MIYGISYTSRQFANRYVPITQQANQSGLFDHFQCFREEDIDPAFKKEYSDIWNDARGGGWWIWKAHIIYQKLQQITEDDILVYMDGGCQINITNESVRRFQEYVDMVKTHPQGLLLFQLTHPEWKYTNSKTFSYFSQHFNASMNDHYKSNQFAGTIMIMRKTPFVMEFYTNVLDILKYDRFLFTDKYTIGSQQHRHDQSIQSLLYKVMNGTLFLEDETWFVDFGSNSAKQFPIWATRRRN